MRKKVINGKRVLALALALSLVASDSTLLFAAPADEQAAQTEAVVEEITEEVENSQETEAAEDEAAAEDSVEAAARQDAAQTDAPAREAEQAEAETAAETEDAADVEVSDEAVVVADKAATEEINAVEDETAVPARDEEIEAEGAYNGTPSKVIGLEGSVETWHEWDSTTGSMVQKSYALISWNPITTVNVTMAGGKELKIGYQVEKNGVIVTDDLDTLKAQTNPGYYDQALAAGQTATYRVRAVYYTETESATGSNVYTQVAVGEWSNAYAYNFKVNPWPGVQITGVKQVNNKIVLSFNENPDYTYYCEAFYSSTPVAGVTAANFSGIRDDNIYLDWDEHTTGKYVFDKYFENAQNIYFHIFVSRAENCVAPDTGYYDTGAVTSIEYKPVAGTQAITGLAVKSRPNGTKFLSWNPTQTSLNMKIFAYESASFPAYYTYKDTSFRSSERAYAVSLPAQYTKPWDKVKMVELDRSSMDGEYNLSNFDDLEYGKTYYFVAYTYTTGDYHDVVTVDGNKYQSEYIFSQASNMTSGKLVPGKPSVTVESGKTSVKLHLSGNDGYEISRKSGKKYKVLGTIAGDEFEDTGLKEDTKYTYRVRGYAYNKNTKTKVYSDYKTLTAETTQSKNIVLYGKKKSKNSVALSWTKVKNATKYEIYRSETGSAAPNTLSKKYDSAKAYTTYLSNSKKYTLIKTLKASQKSYTDKKLTAGKTYSYVIIAYYKNGKKTEYITDEYNASMEISAPRNVSYSANATSVKFTWDKDPYATGFEVRYNISDAAGYFAADGYPYKKTIGKKSTSFTVSGVPTGGVARFKIRTLGSKSVVSDWYYISASATMGVAGSIKASKAADGVKITWKAVSGAKYYRVYRSTTAPKYNADSKRYIRSGDLIAKEANDDETNDYVGYQDVKSKYGSIVGTTATDRALLDEGVTYYYYVVAYDSYGNYSSVLNGSSENAASSKPATYTVPTTSLKISKVTAKKGKTKLTWNKVAGAKSYYVYRSTKKNSGYVLVGTTKKTSLTDKKTKKTTYYYKVAAAGANGAGADLFTAAKKVKVK